MALCQLPYIMKCINLINCQPIENFSNLFVIVFIVKRRKCTNWNIMLNTASIVKLYACIHKRVSWRSCLKTKNSKKKEKGLNCY